jgi:glycosyltransferase involved in cell wall biosynthesis
MKSSLLLPTYNRKDLLYNSLKSFEYFYGNNESFEIVLVDDCSAEKHQFPTVCEDFPSLNIKYFRIDKKYGFNPSLAYNVAARIATGDVFILSSPETFHTCNILELCNNFEDFQTYDYYLFSVFCLTHNEYRPLMRNENLPIENKLEQFDSFKHELYLNLGCNGYYYNNNFGSWYLHEVIKPSQLNFLTAMSKDLYYELSGFNQAFMRGTGYDDTDFLNRLQPLIKNYKWFEAEALHIDHDLAANIPQNSNFVVYQSLCQNQTYKKNDNWGKLPS